MFGPPLSPSQEHAPFKGMDWTKVIRLEHNALLERSMDLNSLTWLLVTCVLFQMYTTPTLIQSPYSFGHATTWHPNQVQLPIFNILHFTLNVGGEEVPCNLTQVVSYTPSSSNTLSNSIPCVSNYPFVMGN